MTSLLPAINARTEDEFVERAQTLRELGARALQLDVSDGIFGIPENFASPDVVARELSGMEIDVHLMVRDVETAVPIWEAISPARITVHVEVLAHPADVFERIRAGGSQCGLAVGPQTPVEAVFPYLPHIDMLLFVAVPPGASGQHFDTETFARIQLAREQHAQLPIGVDGGVTPELVMDLRAVGTSIIVVASAIFNARDSKAAYAKLKRLIERR